MMLILTIYKVTKIMIIIIRTITIHRTIVIHLFNRKVTITIILPMVIEKNNSTKGVPTYQLQTKNNDNTINDLQSNEDNNNKNDINSSNNSNTPIRSERNRSNNIIKGNRKKNCTSSVPTYYSKNKIVTVTFIINVATMIIVITTQTMFQVKM